MVAVSIVVPCFNEEATIAQLLEAIYTQDFPRSELEVLIADGLSTDATRERIADFQVDHAGLKLTIIDNPARKIPVGLNRAIAVAKGETIVRLDAHCMPNRDYVSRCVKALADGRGWNVGGVWEIRPGGQSWMADSIAVAAAHPLGVGDAFYRFTKEAKQVDTVPFGAFKRTLVDDIGGFDESLYSNEDYELNARIRQAGGKIWLDPEIKSVYFARPTLSKLARQYARYGFWKLRMLRRYPETLRLRQAIPPLFALSLITLPLLGLLWPWLYSVLFVEVVSYVFLLFGAALPKALKQKKIHLFLGIPLAMVTMHLSWGTAFLWSLVRPDHRKAN